ncbi:MAG: IMP cyclohydrolase [Nitrososphaerales archaeon]
MKDDFSALKNMLYIGRGIIIGMNPSGKPFIGYSLTGRSPSSRARILVQEKRTKIIRTEVIDRKSLEEGSPALLLYPAIIPFKEAMIAGNGAHTKLIYSSLINSLKNSNRINPVSILKNAFEKPFFEYDEKEDRWIDLTTYEPDPQNTPRISACLANDHGAMQIVRCNEKGEKEQEIHEFDLKPGFCKIITTYLGMSEKILKPFNGELLNAKISSERVEDIAESLYASIRGKSEQDYRVAVAVMMIDLEAKIINRIER